MAFTPLPGGSGVGGAYTIGDLWRPDIEATIVKDNFDDHEARITDAEDSIVADGIPRAAEVLISSSEIIALNATPKTILAAPGTGKVAEFIGGMLLIGSGTVAYVESGANLAVRYVGSGGVQISEEIETTGFIDQTEDTLAMVLPKHGAIATKAESENQPLVLHNLSAQEYTTGDGILRFKFGYRVWTTQW